MPETTIFSQFFTRPQDLEDRLLLEPQLKPVDVIIPLINTNPLFTRNLYNFYQRVPIRRLIIGNGGCTDDSIRIAQSFPRVKIIDQSHHRTLGKCIAELIELVETEWFIYFHADVFLPEGWFETMSQFQGTYDWFECNQRNSVMCDYWNINHANKKEHRAFSGAQMGRKAALQSVTAKISDDFLQRQEDAVLAYLIEDHGFKYGRVTDTYIHHQLMNKSEGKEPKLKHVFIERESDPEWVAKMANMQVRGYIKYTKPTLDTKINVHATLQAMNSLKILDEKALLNWVKDNYPVWHTPIKEFISSFKIIQRRRKIMAILKGILIRLKLMSKPIELE